MKKGQPQDSEVVRLYKQVVMEAQALFSSGNQDFNLEQTPRQGIEDVVEAKKSVLTHPLYSELIKTYFDCKKIGVITPSELEELNSLMRRLIQLAPPSDDNPSPEMDSFMEEYVGLLKFYSNELSKTYKEASIVCNNFEEKLKTLSLSFTEPRRFNLEDADDDEDEFVVPSEVEDETEEELSSEGGSLWNSSDANPNLTDEALKEELKKRYASYLCSLKQDYLKKKKKGKLPKGATETLLEWWQAHIKWPYPTEAEKVQLAEGTGLDSKQINNWFINQRKRHWSHGDAHAARK